MPAMPTPAARDAAPPAAPAPLQVTISEAARLLAYNPRTIRRLVVRGELTIVGQGRLRRVSMQSIHAYQERYLQAGA